MKRPLKVVLAVVGLILFGSGAFIGGYAFRGVRNPELSTLDFVLSHYKKYYLEESDDYVSVMANSILDKYSAYYTKEEYEIIEKASKGVRSGIGVSFGADSTTEKGAHILLVKFNSPAEKAGIKEKGYIVGGKKSKETDYTAIDGYSDLAVFMDGVDDNEEFSLRIKYDTVHEFTLKRSEYRETFVEYSDESGTYSYTDKSGSLELKRKGDAIAAFPADAAYLRYTSFNGLGSDLYASAVQIKQVLGILKAGGRKKLILDLRNNGGGYLDIMQKVLSHFIDVPDGSGKQVCVVKDKSGKKTAYVSSGADFRSYGFTSVAILANENTASASEAFIGAVLDYDRNGIYKVVLSRVADKDGYSYRTYGKGIMQTYYSNFGTGEVIKLTTAKLYWPVSDVCIHDVGVRKDTSGTGGRVYEAPYVAGVDYELTYALTLI